MPRIAHIKNGQIYNVSNGADDWTPPEDGSQMLEADALALGFTYAPREPEKVETVSMRSLRFALIDAGLLSSVSAVIAAIPDAIQRSKAEVWWDYSITVSRKHELVSSIGSALTLTEEQIDAIFQSAFTHDNQAAS